MDCCGGTDEHDDDCEVIVKESIDEKTVAAAKALEAENYSAGFRDRDRDRIRAYGPQ